MKKIIETLLALLLAIAFMAGLAVFVLPDPVHGQAGTGPLGKRVDDHSNGVLVLPNMQPSPGISGVPNNAVTIYGGNLYVYNSTTGLWSKATLATPTPTASSTNTPTPTATATFTPTPTP